MCPDHDPSASDETVSTRGGRLPDWLRDQDARDLAEFARAVRESETSFLGHLLDGP